MLDRRPLDHVSVAKSWLADAARAEASLLEPVKLVSDIICDHELVLVRYTKQLHLTDYLARFSGPYGAMWTNVVTTYSPETADITGGDLRGHWKGLQVVRFAMPGDFWLPYETAHGNNHCPLWMGDLKNCAKEFWVRIDIPARHIANIPFDYNAETKTFEQPSDYHVPEVDMSRPLARFIC